MATKRKPTKFHALENKWFVKYVVSFPQQLRFQEHLLEGLVFVYIGDEDGRVRKASAQTLVKWVNILDELYYIEKKLKIK